MDTYRKLLENNVTKVHPAARFPMSYNGHIHNNAGLKNYICHRSSDEVKLNRMSVRMVQDFP